MEAQQITNDNFRKDKKKNKNTLYVNADYFNSLVRDVEYLSPVYDVEFDGEVDLSKGSTIYDDYHVETNLAITLKAITISPFTPKPGSYAELRLVGDGSHTPSFSGDFTATPSSEVYDNTLNKVNKVGVYYDGYDVFYTITVLT